MSKEVKIEFGVNGSVSQSIKILNGDSKKDFIKKIKNGDYLTSICGKDIMSIPEFKKVGEVVDQETGDNTEFDFNAFD